MARSAPSSRQKSTRVETDSFGPIDVPADRYWGAQTQRSLQNFRIGWEKQPKPIVKALSFPLTLATLGLVSFLINAAMLLLAAWISTEVLKLHFTIADFPPTFSGDALIAAILGSIVISIVSTVLGLVNFGRRAVF